MFGSRCDCEAICKKIRRGDGTSHMLEHVSLVVRRQAWLIVSKLITRKSWKHILEDWLVVTRFRSKVKSVANAARRPFRFAHVC